MRPQRGIYWGEAVTPHDGAEEVNSGAQEVLLRKVRDTSFCRVWHPEGSQTEVTSSQAWKNRQVEEGDGGPSRKRGRPGTTLEAGPSQRPPSHTTS